MYRRNMPQLQGLTGHTCFQTMHPGSGKLSSAELKGVLQCIEYKLPKRRKEKALAALQGMEAAAAAVQEQERQMEGITTLQVRGIHAVCLCSHA